MTTYVLAGSEEQYRAWLEEHDLPRHEVRSLTRPQTVNGMRFTVDDRLELVGTWWRRPDLGEMLATIQISTMFSPVRPRHIADIIDPLIADRHGRHEAVRT